MKHMIKWLKVCAFLLAVMLILHTLEIVYDIMYHAPGNIFEGHNPANKTSIAYRR